VGRPVGHTREDIPAPASNRIRFRIRLRRAACRLSEAVRKAI